jgi:hypothetical protein
VAYAFEPPALLSAFLPAKGVAEAYALKAEDKLRAYFDNIVANSTATLPGGLGADVEGVQVRTTHTVPFLCHVHMWLTCAACVTSGLKNNVWSDTWTSKVRKLLQYCIVIWRVCSVVYNLTTLTANTAFAHAFFLLLQSFVCLLLRTHYILALTVLALCNLRTCLFTVPVHTGVGILRPWTRCSSNECTTWHCYALAARELHCHLSKGSTLLFSPCYMWYQDHVALSYCSVRNVLLVAAVLCQIALTTVNNAEAEQACDSAFCWRANCSSVRIVACFTLHLL